MNITKKLLFPLLLVATLFTSACFDDTPAKKSDNEPCVAASECESGSCDSSSHMCAPKVPKVKVDVNQPCTDNSECKTGVCNTTVTPHLCAFISKGKECEESDQCDDTQGFVCSGTPKKTCNKPGDRAVADGSACAKNEQCNHGSSCDKTTDPRNPVCKVLADGSVADGGDCAKNEQCKASGSTCTQNKCTAPGDHSVADGGDCSDTKQCKKAGSICDSTSKCSAAPNGSLEQGEDCKTTAQCDLSKSLVCVKNGLGRSICSISCTSPTDCKDPKSPQPYNSCSKTKDDTNSDKQACIAKKIAGEACDKSEECDDSKKLVCDTSKKCAIPTDRSVADGGDCAGDEQCKASGSTCDKNKCTPPQSKSVATGGSCSNTSQCEDVSGKTVKCVKIDSMTSVCSIECTAATECSTAPYSVCLDQQKDGTGSPISNKVCTQKQPKGAHCNVKDDCLSDKCDTSSKCVLKGTSETCTASSECDDSVGLVCDTTSSKCNKPADHMVKDGDDCANEDQCHYGSFCDKVTDPTHPVCKKHDDGSVDDGNACGTNEQCKSGKCDMTTTHKCLLSVNATCTAATECATGNCDSATKKCK